MKVNIVFVKMEGEKRIEIPYEEMGEEERADQARKLKKKFLEGFGYTIKESTA